MSQLYFVVVGSDAARQAAPLRGVAVTGLIRDAVAKYTMTQTYMNPLPNNYIEAAYTFPLYEGVAVVGFQAEVDGRKIVGKVREKVAAKEEYQEAVRDGKTASLLEEEKPDLFQACINNIPPGKTISVRITLVSEMKQDAGENQVRFVLPTTVAPRYGQHNSGFTVGDRGLGFGNWNSSSSVLVSKLSVNMACAMSKPITSVQSPSHTIEVHVGTTETSRSFESYAFDPSSARVSLTADSLLDRDLVIIIQSLMLDLPRVLVERHPTDQTHAMSLTFQPRFSLQPLRACELFFLVDVRSGPLFGAPDMTRAGEALELFLRHIPFENHYFNVIGPVTALFGSTQQALFPTSVEFNAESLRVGVQYAQAIPANKSGTDVASAFQEVFQRRRRDVPTQVFLLTDGQISNVEQLGRGISNAVDDSERSNQPLRVFCLGIGDSVSHHLIESAARAGRGYAQLVMAGERMEKKVLNMLKAGLMPPVTDTTIQWTDSIVDNFVMVEGEEGADNDLALVNKNAGKPLINLFSESEFPPVVLENTPPPEISVTVHQAPFKLPVLCPGARFTVYAILSPTTPLPKELVLRGVSPDGPVELRVKIESVVESETMLHSLAARALVRDLEEASSSIHALGKKLTPYEKQKLKHLGVSVAQAEGQKLSDIIPLSFNHVAEITNQKMVDIGVRYNVSTKCTSWVAIDEEGPRKARDVIPAGSYIVHGAQSPPRVFHTTVCFGQTTPTSGSSFFGQATPAFSSGAPQAASSGGVFAQQAASSAICTPFGGQTTPGLFGSYTPATGAQCQPSFSGYTFGESSTPAFGSQASSSGAFQASSAPAIGATPASAFGITQASGFGAPPASAFGTPQASGFQASGFGAPPASAFGTTPASAFGTPPASAFGALQPSAFGVAPLSGGFSFGPAQGSPSGASTAQPVASSSSTSTSLFRSAPAPQASPFGGGFGLPSTFGSNEKPQQVEMETKDLHQQQVLQAEDQAATCSSDPHTQLRSLLQHQSLDGLFPLVPATAALLNTSADKLKTKLRELRKHCTGSMELAEEQWEAIWATCLAVEFLKSKMMELQDEWELLVEKAERRVESLLKNSDHLARFKAAATAP